jgi:DNA-binding transcriptional MerR regulator
MPTELTLQELADLAGVTPRTIRYYIAQGLLPSPGRVGPGATYGETHLARLRLIRKLQREHLPLAEIRAQLAALDDASVVALAEAAPSEPADSAADYIRNLLDAQPFLGQRRRAQSPSPALSMPHPAAVSRLMDAPIEPTPPPAASAPPPSAEPSAPDRSQWDRIVLVPDVELHVRRPLTRQLNKQVERLVAIARQLLEEE